MNDKDRDEFMKITLAAAWREDVIVCVCVCVWCVGRVTGDESQQGSAVNICMEYINETPGNTDKDAGSDSRDN